MTRVRTLEHIADVRRRPGTQRPLTRALPAHALGALVTSAAQVEPDAEVVLDGTVEATGIDIVLTGTVSFPWEGDCRRCLQPVEGEVTADLREIFEPTPVEGETWPVEGDAIDLAPVLREVVLLTLPLVPLCSEDCAGPDPERFPTVVEGEATDPDEGGRAPAAPRRPPVGRPRRPPLRRLIPMVAEAPHFASGTVGRYHLLSVPRRLRAPAPSPLRTRTDCDGRPQEEDLQVEEPEPTGLRVAPRCAVAQHLLALRLREAAAPGVRHLRLVQGPPGPRRRLITPVERR